MKNGDYVPDGRGGCLRAEGRSELLQRVLWKLSVRRGSFLFLAGLGSRLHTLTREKPSAWEALARQYAAEALAEEAGLTVDGVDLAETEGKLELTVHLSWNGESMALKLELEE